MTLFAMIGTDRPGAIEARLAARPEHLAYLQAHPDVVKLAGPLLDDDGSPIGSLVVFEAPSRAEVEAFAAKDPYALAGVFERVEIRPWRLGIGAVE
jgi:uncharacterized protein YciI